VNDLIGGDRVRLRRAALDDVDFLLELETQDDVEPFLEGGRARTREELIAEVERQRKEPRDFGRFLIEVDQSGAWLRAGALSFEVANRRSRIAWLGRLAVHRDFRGRGLADEAARLLQRHLLFDLDYHRLELEIYGFNERALAARRARGLRS
jgi:RimJ/RimL family protein N-acetyltransferase